MGLVTGLVAGLVARKIFERVWSVADENDPPTPEEEALDLKKLAFALVLEGAVFSLVRGLTDHGARVAFRNYTGAWPGESGEEEAGS